MSRTLLLDVGRELTRVALLHNGRPEAFDLTRHEGSRLVGQLFLGVVSRVVPGLQAAFVDLGLDRAGFLHSKDVRGPAFPAMAEARASGAALPPLESQLKAGDRILVQVVKDPLGSKGPRLRTAPTLPSRLPSGTCSTSPGCTSWDTPSGPSSGCPTSPSTTRA